MPRVATHKLLARKRPHLIPIRDSVVETALLPGVDEWWRPWWATLSDRPDLVVQLEELRAAAEAGDRSLLRLADIAVWMWHRGADQVPGLRAEVGSLERDGCRIGTAARFEPGRVQRRGPRWRSIWEGR